MAKRSTLYLAMRPDSVARLRGSFVIDKSIYVRRRKVAEKTRGERDRESGIALPSKVISSGERGSSTERFRSLEAQRQKERKREREREMRLRFSEKRGTSLRRAMRPDET